MRKASRPSHITIALILFFAAIFALSGCSGKAAATRNELPTGASDTLHSVIDALFTWRPTFDDSIAVAFQRARPYLTDQALPLLIDLEDESPAGWKSWKDEGALITPTFTMQAAPGTTDTYTQYNLLVRVTQHVRNAQGKNLGDLTFELKPLILTFVDGKWRVSRIDGLDTAGGGICPRDPDGTCRTPARDLTTTTPAPTTTPR